MSGTVTLAWAVNAVMAISSTIFHRNLAVHHNMASYIYLMISSTCVICVPQNVKEVFGLSTVELDGVNEASDCDGYSVSSFKPGEKMEVSGEPVVQGA